MKGESAFGRVISQSKELCMNFNNFKTYSDSPQNAFETFITQLFERYLRRKYRTCHCQFTLNGIN